MGAPSRFRGQEIVNEKNNNMEMKMPSISAGPISGMSREAAGTEPRVLLRGSVCIGTFIALDLVHMRATHYHCPISSM